MYDTTEVAEKLLRETKCKCTRSTPKGCSCVKRTPNGAVTVNCFEQFEPNEVEKFWNFSRKGKSENDIDGTIMMKLCESELKNGSFHYTIMGKHVCRQAFRSLFRISNDKLQSLTKDAKQGKTLEGRVMDKKINRGIGQKSTTYDKHYYCVILSVHYFTRMCRKECWS
jgi:hypothetical protein